MRALNTKLLTGFLREKTNREFMFQMSSMQNHTIGKLKGEVHRGLGRLLCWPLFPQPTQHSWEAQRYCLGNSLFLCSPKNSSGGSEMVPHTLFTGNNAISLVSVVREWTQLCKWWTRFCCTFSASRYETGIVYTHQWQWLFLARITSGNSGYSGVMPEPFPQSS